MATTVYIPPDLLKTIDRRARALKVSRNRYILDALKSRVEQQGDATGWPPGFLEYFRANATDVETQRAGGELQRALDRKRFSQKKPPKL